MPHDAGDFLLQRKRGVFVQPDGDREIGDRQFLHNVQHEEGRFVRDLLSVFVHSGQHEVLVVLRVARSDGRFRLDPLAALDEEGGQKLAGFVPIQQAVPKVLLQIAAQQPIDAPDARPIAAKAHKGENEP